MNIPSIPTDNLYKFIAIFGLVILSLGIYLNSKGLDELIDNKKRMASADFRFFQDSVKHAYKRKSYDSILKQLDEDLESRNNSLDFYKEQLNHMNDIFEEVEKLSEEVNVSHLNLVNNKNEVEAYNIVYNKNALITNLLVFVGVFLVVYGFIFWYYKHQRYIDAERKWKGETFVELLKDKEAKKKAIQDELNKKSDDNEELQDN